MIDIKELRIGNYVNVIFEKEIDRGNGIIEDVEFNEIVEVTGIDNLGLIWDEEDREWNEKDVSPIPITEEWLIKLGFEKPVISWICNFSFCSNKFLLTEWDNDKGSWIISLNKNNGVLIDKAKYIHQLQNLYFALTGKELKNQRLKNIF